MNAPLGFAGYVVPAAQNLVAREEAVRPSSTTSWIVAHRRLLAIGKKRSSLEHELCEWLVTAERLGVARRCGMASLFEYAERNLGLSRRQTEERLRVGKAIAAMPAMGDALKRGTLTFSHARELSRVATEDTEQEWLDWALSGEGGARRGVREVEKAVAQREVGQRPSDEGDPTRQKHRLSFEVKAETMALFRDLQAAIRADLGEDVDDDTLLLEVARRALGADDEGRANYQVAVSRCDDCQRSRIEAGGEAHPVDEAVSAMAECDAQHVGEVESHPHVGALPRRATQTIPPATRRRVLRRDGKQCVVPGCRNHRFLDLHHLTPRSEGGTHEPDNLVTLCGAHHRAAHEGALVVEGSPAAGLRFRHADATPYGAPTPSPEAIDLAQQVFTGLVNLGFKPTEAHRRIARVQARATPVDLETFLRRALRG